MEYTVFRWNGKKIQAKEGLDIPGCHEGAFLNSVVRKGSKNKQVAFKHRPEVNERASHEGTASARVLR